MERLRVGIVGCGQIADGHVSEIQKIGKGDVVAVCDAETIIAEQLATRFRVPAFYRSAEQMLEKEKLDVLHICTPPASHLSLAKAAIDAGCHVYVEKPLALDYRKTVELIAYAEKGGKKLTIGHNSQFEPPSLQLRKMVRDGVLGDPVHIESWYGYNLDGPFGKAIMSSPEHWVHKLPGQLFHNNINHMLNKIVEFLDADFPAVQAMAWRSPDRRGYGDCRDLMQDELRTMIRGKKVSAYGTFSCAVRPVGTYLRFYGTKGIVDLDYTSRSVALDRGVSYPSAIGRLIAGYDRAWQYAKSALSNTRKFYHYDYHYFSGMGLLIGSFYDSILKDLPPPIRSESITQIAWIMDEVFSQIKEQQQ